VFALHRLTEDSSCLCRCRAVRARATAQGEQRRRRFGNQKTFDRDIQGGRLNHAQALGRQCGPHFPPAQPHFFLLARHIPTCWCFLRGASPHTDLIDLCAVGGEHSDDGRGRCGGGCPRSFPRRPCCAHVMCPQCVDLSHITSIVHLCLCCTVNSNVTEKE